MKREGDATDASNSREKERHLYTYKHFRGSHPKPQVGRLQVSQRRLLAGGGANDCGARPPADEGNTGGVLSAGRPGACVYGCKHGAHDDGPRTDNSPSRASREASAVAVGQCPLEFADVALEAAP